MKVVDKARAIFDRIVDVLAVISGVILIILMLMVCYSVAVRYIFNSPMSGINEISEYCVLFITFLVATWVLRKEGHVPIDIMLELLSPRAKALTNAATTIICAIASLVLAWFGAKITLEHFSSSLRLTTLLMPPSYLIMFIIPLGFLLLFVQLVRRARRFLVLSPSEPEKKSGKVSIGK